MNRYLIILIIIALIIIALVYVEATERAGEVGSVSTEEVGSVKPPPEAELADLENEVNTAGSLDVDSDYQGIDAEVEAAFSQKVR